jgi:thiamine pyrophosphate-dependent acetolactate synthase large subunit-like protein
MTTVAALVIERLSSLGVDTAFAIPGTHNLELFRAMHEVGIRVVTAHHEQGLGYAADGYSRVTGRPAVVVTTTGPGITNVTTALATSLAASVPVLAIAPGVPEAAHRAAVGWLHELPSQIDHLATLVPSRRASDAGDALDFIQETFYRWSTQRRTPAYLEIPLDVLESDVPSGEIASSGPATAPRTKADPQDVAAAAQVLAAARKPAIVAGRGACGDPEAVARLAERLAAPVLTTANAKGLLDEHHPLSMGVGLRLAEGHRVLEAADCLVVAGTDLGPSETWAPELPPVGTVIRIDVESGQLHKNVPSAYPLHGDAGVVLRQLLEHLAPQDAPRPSWSSNHLADRWQQIDEQGSIYRPFHEAISEVFPGDTAIAGDSSQVTYFGTAYYWAAPRPNRFLYPAGYGTLGYAVPAAIGAAVSGAVENVVAVTGEGGFMFSVQEFATAARMGLRIPVVVFSNGGFKEISDGMKSRGMVPTAVDFDVPHLEGLARSLHGEARTARSPEEFRVALEQAKGASGPTLIHVPLG